MQQTKMVSKEWMYEAILNMAKDEQDKMSMQVLEDTKQSFRLNSIETQGMDPAKPTGTDGPTDVEEEINSINSELENEATIGRPKDVVRYGKDDHKDGRDPLGIKTLKAKEGSVKYKPRKVSYLEIFKDMKWSLKCGECGCPLRAKVYTKMTYLNKDKSCPLDKWKEIEMEYLDKHSDAVKYKTKKTFL
jgi:hypothetical protein